MTVQRTNYLLHLRFKVFERSNNFFLVYQFETIQIEVALVISTSLQVARMCWLISDLANIPHILRKSATR